MSSLYKAIQSLKDESEIKRFMRDLCTPREIEEFESRWQIAQLLNEGQLSYREIAAKAKTSVTTVTRVARFLKDEPHQGYRLVLDRQAGAKS